MREVPLRVGGSDALSGQPRACLAVGRQNRVNYLVTFAVQGKITRKQTWAWIVKEYFSLDTESHPAPYHSRLQDPPLTEILTEIRSKQGRAAQISETLQDYNIIYSCGLALLVHLFFFITFKPRVE